MPSAAGDVFQLNSLPQNKSKELSVNASFFEIYNGKVCHITAMGRGMSHNSNGKVCHITAMGRYVT